jgi:hypothetical protein
MKWSISILILCIKASLFSQSWCPSGANWKYNYMNFWNEGYTEIKYDSDTLIEGQLSKKLIKTIHSYDYITESLGSYPIGFEYTYEDNGVVFLRFNDHWDTLYNFNAQVGESWRAAKQPYTTVCDSNAMISVLEIGNTMINDESLRYLYVLVDFQGENALPFTDTIVEKIGFLNYYMLPYNFCDAQVDWIEGGSLRCYSDDNFETYKHNFEEECDFIVGMNELNESETRISPNPTSSLITFSSVVDYTIYSVAGSELLSGKAQTSADLSKLPAAVYLVEMKNGDFIQRARVVKE